MTAAAAYKRAMDALEDCYRQGWEDEPLSGDPLLYVAVSDDHISRGTGRVNAFRQKYERGLLKLRYFVYPDEFDQFDGMLHEWAPSKTDASGVSHG